MTRKNPVTAVGQAMRQIYDRFGLARVFANNSILPAALGDLLEDSRQLRAQVKTAFTAGIGSIYVNQLRNVGQPTPAFYARIKSLLVEEAGLSEKVAAELTGYYDEMIGWKAAVSAPPPQPDRGTTPPPRPDRGTPPRPPVNDDPIPLPGAAVPLRDQGCLHALAQWLFMGALIVIICGGVASAVTGLWIGLIGVVIGFFICIKIIEALDTIPGERKITSGNTGSAVELSWTGSIDKFAVAVGDKWVLTGTGSKAVLDGLLFAHFRPGEKYKVTLAEITDSGVVYRGQLKLRHPKQP